MEEIAAGIWHWTAKHPKIGMDVSSYFLPEQGVLLDPMAPPGGLDRLEELGPPREILLTNRHHYRDCQALVERFGCSVRAPRVGMHEFQSGEPVEPYDFGEQLAGGAITVHEVGGICPDESALHAAPVRALAVADAVVHYGDELSFVPDDYMDDPEGDKEAMRASYRRLVGELDFEHLLTAHGTPLVGDARERLRRFAEAS
jgi:glyoxylase-like metal-dependent hydrolase (beta-lactamase superfamily II)